MTVQLWTVYTCVFTNILGLHLALRGPEGSVDRAVRHMAQQNRGALKKFTAGLVLFLASVIFFSLAEYYIYVSIIIVILVSRRQTRTDTGGTAGGAAREKNSRTRVPPVPSPAVASPVPAIADADRLVQHLQEHPLPRQRLLLGQGAHGHGAVHLPG